MNVQGVEVTVREALPGDLNFILASWLKSVYYGSSFYGLIDQDAYYLNYEKEIKQRLITANVRIACLADDQDVILGYSVSHGNTLDMVFVKRSYRGVGIAKMLVPETTDTVSQITDLGNSIRRKKNLKLNPWSNT